VRFAKLGKNEVLQLSKTKDMLFALPLVKRWEKCVMEERQEAKNTSHSFIGFYVIKP